MSTPDLTRARWVKSSRSSNNGACVEVASVSGSVAARDSKNPDRPALVFRGSQWEGFLNTVKSGSLDLG